MVRESIVSAESGSLLLLQAAAASWEQHTRGNKEQSANTIVPICESTQNQASAARDLLEREVAAFHRSPDNRSYMMPATSQVLSPRHYVHHASYPGEYVQPHSCSHRFAFS